MTVAVATNPPRAVPGHAFLLQPTLRKANTKIVRRLRSAAGREDIMAINLASCSGNKAPVARLFRGQSYGLGEIVITFPTTIDASQITVDPSEPSYGGGKYYVLATTGGNACQTTLPPNAICLNPGGSAYNAVNGSNTTVAIIPAGMYASLA